MKIPDSLWYETETRERGRVVDFKLTRCRNCGEVKVLSPICSLDHLAAVMEFNAHAPTTRTPEESPDE